MRVVQGVYFGSDPTSQDPSYEHSCTSPDYLNILTEIKSLDREKGMVVCSRTTRESTAYRGKILKGKAF